MRATAPSLLRGSLLNSADTATSLVSAVIVSILLARLLGPDRFGLYALVTTVVNFTLLFVYATLNREQTFYLLIIPIRVTFLAWLALAALVTGVFFGGRSNLAVLIGAAAGYAYYLSQRVGVVAVSPRRAPSAQDAAVTSMTLWRRSTGNTAKCLCCATWNN